MYTKEDPTTLMKTQSNQLVCKERYGSDPISRQYIRSEYGKIVLLETNAKFDTVWHFLRDVFLPQGYPDSVSEDYLEYQLWDTVQAFASSITGTLAAEAILKGYGVGNKEAAILGATMTWMLKEGTGMLGRILFTWAQGMSLDCDAKRWRLFADILNDIAICLEIISPLFASNFVLVICTAGLFKSIVGVAGGATRAALTQHQARRDNMADVSAKDGSQETLVNLAALMCGLIIMPVVSGNANLVWFLFFLLTSVHIFANYRAVCCVVMETVNQARLQIMVKEWLCNSRQLDVKSVNYKEPVLFAMRNKFKIKLGVSMKSLTCCGRNVESIRGLYISEKYILDLDFHKKEINIILSKDCTAEDQIKACFHAHVLNQVNNLIPQWQSYDSIDTELDDLVDSFTKEIGEEVLEKSYSYIRQNYDKFLAKLKRKGWITTRTQLGPDEWRADWNTT